MHPTTQVFEPMTSASIESLIQSGDDARSLNAESQLAKQFRDVRNQSEKIAAPLTPEDMMVQSCAEASPAKWHLAHTTWFYETFILSEFAPGYTPFNPDFVWLFNSYYNSVSEHPEKKLRASFSRPSIEAIYDYRRHVDSAILDLLASGHEPAKQNEVSNRVILGLNHEQQHQELMVTDIKHAFWTNPLHPAYGDGPLPSSETAASPLRWLGYSGGVREIGYDGNGFSFDNERPRHQEYVEPFEIASRLITCAEYLEFMESGGYERPELWLSEGWDTLQLEGWRAPLYWHRAAGTGDWSVFTLQGLVPLTKIETTPVCHVSYFEADAFARWAGKTLPTEAQWEIAAGEASVNTPGNFLERGALHPQSLTDLNLSADQSTVPAQIFGDVWEWTCSPYIGYPRFAPLPGALGEYNGKFMCNQMVLRGGSAVTPQSHIRETYRNFFSARTRWQFSGIRLAQLT